MQRGYPPSPILYHIHVLIVPVQTQGSQHWWKSSKESTCSTCCIAAFNVAHWDACFTAPCTLTASCSIRLSEVEQTHSQHIIKLQHSLREEIDGRQAAERALTELRGDVSIGMEDTSPVMLTQGTRDNFGSFSPLLLGLCVLWWSHLHVHAYVFSFGCGYGCECEGWMLCCVCCGFSTLISDSLEWPQQQLRMLIDSHRDLGS